MTDRAALVIQKLVRDARFRHLHVATKEKDVMFARCTDFWPFGRLTFYDRPANRTFVQAAEECPKEMNVEECVR